MLIHGHNYRNQISVFSNIKYNVQPIFLQRVSPSKFRDFFQNFLIEVMVLNWLLWFKWEGYCFSVVNFRNLYISLKNFIWATFINRPEFRIIKLMKIVAKTWIGSKKEFEQNTVDIPLVTHFWHTLSDTFSLSDTYFQQKWKFSRFKPFFSGELWKISNLFFQKVIKLTNRLHLH